MYNQFKSITYKRKYYSISFKLNFILSSTLFKVEDKEYKMKDEKNHIMFRGIVSVVYDRFIFNKVVYCRYLNNDNTRIEYHYEYDNHHSSNNLANYFVFENNIKIVEGYYINNLCHREEDKPAIIQYYEDGSVKCEFYYKNGKRHRDNGPASIIYVNGNVIGRAYFKYGNLKQELFMSNGVAHNEDGPAEISYYENGNIKSEIYYCNNKKHREDGPAEISYYENGNIQFESYYFQHLLHREDGPAFTEYNNDGSILEQTYYFLGRVVQEEDLQDN